MLMHKTLEASKRQLVAIADPHISTHPHSKVFQLAVSRRKGGIFIKDKNGVLAFNGQCWPGNSVYIDFMNFEGATFWSELYNNEILAGLNRT
jgi:alpha 1,3-glucosidase